MNVLCITDQFEGSSHSAIEGVFNRTLPHQDRVFITFFTKVHSKGHQQGNRIILPYAFKRRDICQELDHYISLKDIDIVIVRNFFPVLKRVLRGRSRYGYKVGFWPSFPHSFRRVFEAQARRKALFRKTLEYKISRYFENRLVQQCDFLIVMSDLFKKTWFPAFASDVFVLPMGVNFESLPSPEPGGTGKIGFIHTGTADPLRKSALVAEAFNETPGEFVLHFYTASRNETVARIKKLKDPRIEVFPFLPRNQLFQKMKKYDIGVGLIPDNELYRVSSPTKTLEYYGLGLPALLNHLPEYDALFDDRCAFFAEFTKEGIRSKVEEILKTSKDRLQLMGECGRVIVQENRNYRVLADHLFQFLRNITLKAVFTKMHQGG